MPRLTNISSAIKMEVLAVSKAEPQWHDIRGQRIYTSIIHKPLTSKENSILLQPEQGIERNSTSAHNAEVYVFFAHHYDFWSRELNVVRNTWDWCHWGENITLKCPKDMNEANFHLGDVWKVGKGVVLQVCGSRVPCFKLAWRCGQKDSWLQKLADSGKCGVYLKVLQGGRIYPGDEAELVRKRVHGPLLDCATISRVAFSDAQSTRTTMCLLEDDLDLLDMNKLVFRRKLSMLYDQELVGKNTWNGWRRVQVTTVVDESPDVKSFYIKATSPPVTDTKQKLAAYLPGHFITVRLPNGLVRSWSLSSYPDNETRESPTQYRVSIRLNGKASKWMHNNCAAGTLLDIRAPSGSFCLDWSPQFPGRQIYVSSGIGVTPMIAMLQAHLQHQAMKRSPAAWIHVSRTFESVPLIQQLLSLLAQPTARELGMDVILFLTQFSSEKCAALEKSLVGKVGSQIRIRVNSGRPTDETLHPLISSPYFMDPLQITPIETEGRFSTVYICGTPSFDTTMRKLFEDEGVSPAMILSESFSGKAVASKASNVKKSHVVFSRSKRSTTWERRKSKGDKKPNDSDYGPSLLELAEQVGLLPDYGCRTGVCGACEVAMSCGRVTGGLQTDGRVRVCIARPASEKIEISL